jgi:hypothetical protein
LGEENVRWLSDMLYGSVPAVFESHFGLEESVARLSAATRRFVLLPMQPAAVGRVSKDRVSLRRATPFVGNSFAPFFSGAFVERDDGRAVLFGHFTLHWSVKAFMTLWLGACLFWTSVAALTLAAARDPRAWWLPLAGVAMLGFGVGLVWFCRWLARNDIAWLSSVIRDSLSPRALSGWYEAEQSTCS